MGCGQRWRWGNSADDIVMLGLWETYYLLPGVSQGWMFSLSSVSIPHPLWKWGQEVEVGGDLYFGFESP